MKNIKLLSIIMIILILLNSAVVLAAADDVLVLGYIKGYEYGKNKATISNLDKTFIPYEKATLSYNEIYNINIVYLKDKTAQEINIFTEEFSKGYEKGYKEIIKTGEDSKDNVNSIIYLSSGFGAAFGMNYGEIAGFKDFEKGVYPSWSKVVPGSTELTNTFNLKNLPYGERNEFLYQFRKNFQIGYEKAYYGGHFGTIKNSLDAGNADGSQLGTNLGAIFGSKDYSENRTSDYKRNMPSDLTIKSEYVLKLDSTDYSNGFINGFKKAYQEAYITSFRESKNNTFLMDQSMGYENGLSVGSIKGSRQASIDYMEKNATDWKRYLPKASVIINEYNLMFQQEKYRDSFIGGFGEGYMTGYVDTYNEVSKTDNESKTTSETIPISGGTVMSMDGLFAVTLNKGTYYKPVILSIDILNDSFYSFDKNYISASSYYRVSLVNPSGTYNNDNKIELSFEYYGDQKGGVYKMVNGKWQYIDSKIDDSSITVMVNPSNLNSTGSVYAVIRNQDVPTFHDIRGHWAKNEIETLIRRKIIYGYTDTTFKPENKITRAEFLTLLSRVYNWSLPTNTANITQFKDSTSFGNRDKIISYAIAHGYIKGYDDNTFKPNDTISYNEIEIIMARSIDKNFKWHDTAAKMLYEKNVRSSSYDNIDNKINRGEVSYMLYILNEWRY